MSHKINGPSKDELEALYNNPDKPISKAAIAKMYNVSRIVVDRWFKDYEIVQKDHDTICRELNAGKAYKIPTYEELYDLYVINQTSITDLIKHYPVSGKDIKGWLETYKIPIRTLSEATTIAKREQYKDIQYDKETVQNAYDKFRHIDLTADHLNISYSHMRVLLKRHDIEVVSPMRSVAETELFEFCQNLYPQFKWEHNVRNILPRNYEVDIVCRELKFAIEYDGLYWHSYEMNNNKNYHQWKYKEMEKLGYRLITIFESDNMEKVKNIIAHKLGKVNNIIAARKTKIKEIESISAKDFHDKYHISGHRDAKVHYGLYYKETLVQVISFSKPRFNSNIEWECYRSSSHYDYLVIGGVSKIFSHFIKDYKVQSLLSYANLRFGTGKVYEKCGLKFTETTIPDYWYFIPSNPEKIYHRSTFQKHKLPQLLEFFDPKLTEEENMKLNKYYKIYDCGNNVYTYRKEN